MRSTSEWAIPLYALIVPITILVLIAAMTCARLFARSGKDSTAEHDEQTRDLSIFDRGF